MTTSSHKHSGRSRKKRAPKAKACAFKQSVTAFLDDPECVEAQDNLDLALIDLALSGKDDVVDRVLDEKSDHINFDNLVYELEYFSESVEFSEGLSVLACIPVIIYTNHQTTPLSKDAADKISRSFRECELIEGDLNVAVLGDLKSLEWIQKSFPGVKKLTMALHHAVYHPGGENSLVDALDKESLDPFEEGVDFVCCLRFLPVLLSGNVDTICNLIHYMSGKWQKKWSDYVNKIIKQEGGYVSVSVHSLSTYSDAILDGVIALTEVKIAGCIVSMIERHDKAPSACTIDVHGVFEEDAYLLIYYQCDGEKLDVERVDIPLSDSIEDMDMIFTDLVNTIGCVCIDNEVGSVRLEGVLIEGGDISNEPGVEMSKTLH